MIPALFNGIQCVAKRGDNRFSLSIRRLFQLILIPLIAACTFLISPVFASEVDSLRNSSHVTSWAYFRAPSSTLWFISNSSGETYGLGRNNSGISAWVEIANGQTVAHLDSLNKSVALNANTATLTPSNAFAATSLVDGTIQQVSGNTANQWAALIAGKTLPMDWYFFQVASTGQWWIVSTNAPSGTPGQILRLKLNAANTQYDWQEPRDASGAIVDTSTWTREFFQEGGVWKVRFRTSTAPADDHGKTMATATVIQENSMTNGNIEVSGDVDFFRINVTSSGTLTVGVGVSGANMSLLASSGQVLVSGGSFGSVSQTVSPGTYYVSVSRALGGTGTYTLSSWLVANAPSRAVLLLHGMNSQPEKWNALVDSRWGGDCKIIYNGVIQSPGIGRVDSGGAVCYRVKFGAFDLGGLTGLFSNITCANDGRYVYASPKQGCEGDYTRIFTSGGNDIGVEVQRAVAAIRAHLASLASSPKPTQIVLLGHSRGGLAARSFLQRPGTSPDISAVVGLITTGTPHKGSPLGRMYKRLKDSCITSDSPNQNPGCAADWNVVGFLLGPTFVTSQGIDLRTPVVGLLSPESQDILDLNTTKQVLLNRGIFIRKLAYKGEDLGHLFEASDVVYHAFNSRGFQLSNEGKSSVLCTPVQVPLAPVCAATEWAADMVGDGIVPYVSQSDAGIGGLLLPTPGSGILHTDEAGGTWELNDALNMSGTWR